MRTVPVYSSLHRRILVAGAEFDLVYITGVFAILLVVGGMTKLSFAVGILFWFGTLPVLQKLAKTDPYMSQVFGRYVKYKDYYPARCSVFRG